MINVNGNLSDPSISSIRAPQAAPAELKEQPVSSDSQKAAGASTVVQLQTGKPEAGAHGAVKADASNASSMVADIASMLGGSGAKVQANLNGFDAARLLAG